MKSFCYNDLHQFKITNFVKIKCCIKGIIKQDIFLNIFLKNQCLELPVNII